MTTATLRKEDTYLGLAYKVRGLAPPAACSPWSFVSPVCSRKCQLVGHSFVSRGSHLLSSSVPNNSASSRPWARSPAPQPESVKRGGCGAWLHPVLQYASWDTHIYARITGTCRRQWQRLHTKPKERGWCRKKNRFLKRHLWNCRNIIYLY